MKRIKFGLTLSLMALLAITGNITAQADTIDTKIQEKIEKIESMTKEQATLKTDLAQIETELKQVENNYQETLKKKIETEEQVAKLEKKSQKLAATIEKRKEVIASQARNTQVNQGSNSVIAALLNAESLSEALQTTIGLGQIISAGNDAMQQQIKDKEELEALKEETQVVLKEVSVQTEQLKEKEVSLAKVKMEQSLKINELAASLTTEQDEKARLVTEKEEMIRKRAEKLAKLKEQQAREKELAAKQAQEELEKQQQVQEKQSAQEAVEESMPVSKEEGTNDDTLIDTQVEDKPAVNASGWQAPVASLILTSPFGYREDPTGFSGTQHDGIDLAGASGTPILASKSGTVVSGGFDGSAGNYLIIDHQDGYFSYYLHLSSSYASVGQTVTAGETIGGMGTTGNSTGVHLHFGIGTSSAWTGFVDPAPLIGL